eukprot:1699821-Pyramimonas_sp.AAC.1
MERKHKVCKICTTPRANTRPDGRDHGPALLRNRIGPIGSLRLGVPSAGQREICSCDSGLSALGSF